MQKNFFALLFTVPPHFQICKARGCRAVFLRTYSAECT
jgi:hypothetical protein